MCAREGRTVLREVDRVRGRLRRARRDILVFALSFRWVVEIVSGFSQSCLMIQVYRM